MQRFLAGDESVARNVAPRAAANPKPANSMRQSGKTAGARSRGRSRQVDARVAAGTRSGVSGGSTAGAQVAVADERTCKGKGSYDEDGVWMACDRCGKWRHLQQVCPPHVDVWYCSPSAISGAARLLALLPPHFHCLRAPGTVR